jgi:hypothetical protein
MKFAVISSNAADTTIVSAVTGRRIRVLSYTMVANAAVTATWKSGTTAISGPMNLAAAGYGVAAAPGGTSLDPIPHMQTAAGEALVLSLGANVAVGGHLTYDVVN